MLERVPTSNGYKLESYALLKKKGGGVQFFVDRSHSREYMVIWEWLYPTGVHTQLKKIRHVKLFRNMNYIQSKYVTNFKKGLVKKYAHDMFSTSCIKPKASTQLFSKRLSEKIRHTIFFWEYALYQKQVCYYFYKAY